MTRLSDNGVSRIVVTRCRTNHCPFQDNPFHALPMTSSCMRPSEYCFYLFLMLLVSHFGFPHLYTSHSVSPAEVCILLSTAPGIFERSCLLAMFCRSQP